MKVFAHLSISFISLLCFSNFTFAESSSKKSVADVVELVQQGCSACHYLPSPDLLPKRSWPYVVKKMAEMAEAKAGQPVFTKEQIRDITAYYYGSSPEELPRLPYFDSAAPGFKHDVKILGKSAKLPLVISLKKTNLTDNVKNEFLICDGETDTVSHLIIDGKKWSETVLAKVKVPSNTAVVDLDKDGDKDILVSALGAFFPPTGTYVGRLVLLEQVESKKFEKRILLEDVGRITDAQPMDLDDDEDLDIIFSVFGGDVPGELAWLENSGKDGKYIKHTLLALGGGLNATPIDINNDGKTDIVSFFTQEDEHIAALVNRGGGNYDYTVLFRSPHPIGGPTSIAFEDIDKDGDKDILFTNGDAHDFQYDPKPYHGIQWLENKGKLEFVYHEIGRYYGAAKAQVGDLDGDGDLDIVASSWNNYWEDNRRQTLVWYENDGKQNFSAHGIVHEPSSIVSFELVDLDSDKSLEILAGLFNIDLLKDYVNLFVKSEKSAEELIANQTLKPRIVKIETIKVKKK